MRPLLAVLLLLSLPASQAENWPSFRGPRASGIAEKGDPPTTWDVEKGANIAWKAEIPGLAHSSPVVWEDRIFLTTAISSKGDTVFQYPLEGKLDERTDTSRHQFRVMCLDQKSGRILWDKLAVETEPRVARHPHNSYAAATPATNGKHVVAFFGSEGLYTFDTTGKLVWKQDLGVLDQGAFDVPDYEWGYASSPIIYKNLAVVQCDQQKGSFIAAFDLDKGREVWRTAREALPSWSTPGIYEGASGAELITNGTEYIRGYDPLTGKELWKLKGTSMISVPTPFVAHNLIFLFSGYWRFIQPMYALRPGARGDITLPKDAASNDHIVWSTQKGAPYLATPLVYGGLLYTCGGNGVLTCYRAATGERVYQERLGQGGYFTSSPVAAAGRIYFASEDGDVYVIKASEKFELLAKNSMTEVTMATPAIAGRMLVYRTLRHLYGIAAK